MKEKSSSEVNHPIDVVIAWVDGDDPKLSEKRNSYLNKPAKSIAPGAHPTRFASINEIRYCVLSIFKFAPFVRNVFIVTDGQDPNLWDDIKTYYPERLGSVRIVDHTEIFEGFEQHLPTFNSISIGHMIWRIKGLSNNFVYFNDDIFLIRDMQPTDWFIDNKPVIRGQWVSAPLLRTLWDKIKISVNRNILGKANYEPRASFHIGQWNSASRLGFKCRYLTVSHTPHAVGRQKVEEYFNRNTSALEKNISYRFREYAQFTFVALSNHLQILAGNRQIAKPDLAYLQPFNRPQNYIDKKIRYCEQNSNIKYFCVQSLEMCSKAEQKKVFDWIESLLNI
jgi:hypothetical protein